MPKIFLIPYVLAEDWPSLHASWRCQLRMRRAFSLSQAQNNEFVADWIELAVDHFDQQVELPSSVEIFLQPAIALYHTSFLSQALQ